MEINSRREWRNQSLQVKKEKPTDELIAELNKMINSIPTLDPESQLQIMDSIFVFSIRFDYDIFRSLSPEQISILLSLTSCQPIQKQFPISYRSIDLFTLLLKNDHTLIKEYMKLNTAQIIIGNLINTSDFNYQISCIAFLYELLKINNELRDQYISLNLPQFITMKCSPYPDKIFFEFLTLLSLKPTFLPELSLYIIQSFITQEVPQERTITVLKCLISLVRTNKSLIIPIISSDFLERIVSSLGRVAHTIATFLKFSAIALQIKEPTILPAFLRINIFGILHSSLGLVEKKEISFSDMLISSIRTDNSPGNTIISANDKLLMHSCNLMNVLLGFNQCLNSLEFVSEFNFSKYLAEGLPYKITVSVIRFILNYLIKMPISIAKKALTEEVIRKAFYIASSSSTDDKFVDSSNEFAAALSLISSKFERDEEVKNLIKNINNEYEYVIIE